MPKHEHRDDPEKAAARRSYEEYRRRSFERCGLPDVDRISLGLRELTLRSASRTPPANNAA